MEQRRRNHNLGDRHIPVRSQTTFKQFSSFCCESQASTNYASILTMGSARTKSNAKVLNYSSRPLALLNEDGTTKKGICGFISDLNQNQKVIPRVEIQYIRQETRLDAPNLSENFYSQTLDVSRGGILGVILGNQINLFNMSTATLIPRQRTTLFSSIKFSPDQSFVYAGDTTGNVQIYSIDNSKPVRRIHQNYTRIGVIETVDQNTFLTGCQWQEICLLDQRIQRPKISSFRKHIAEVCGLSMNRGSNGKYFASGGSQGQVYIWDLRKQTPVSRIKNYAGAVKALKWSPLRYNYLYSAAGQGNKEIVVWNQNQSVIEKRIKVDASTTGIQFNQKRNWMVTAHNIKSRGSVKVWNLRTDQVIKQSHCKNMKVISMMIDPSVPQYVWTTDHKESVRMFNFASKRGSSGKYNISNATNRKSSKLDCSLR